jgi:hypothetical protein
MESLNQSAGKPSEPCPYRQFVKRQFDFLAKVAGYLRRLQDVIDGMDPDFDPTTYYTDPDESRLCVVNEILATIGYLFNTGDVGDAEEAGDLLAGKWEGHLSLYRALQEAFSSLLDAGLEHCEKE